MLVRLVAADDCDICSPHARKLAGERTIEIRPIFVDRKVDLVSLPTLEPCRRRSASRDERPSNVVQAASEVVGDVSEDEAPFDWKWLNLGDEYVNPMALRVIAFPELDSSLSLGVVSPNSDLALQRVGVCYRPGPLEPSAYKEFGIICHGR
jgi:hypothetical protein